MYFETGKGASYLEPQFVAANAVSVEPKNSPTRQGYDFQYWSLAENGEEYTFGQPLSKDITLHAVWDARKDTKYTVIFWKQSVSDDQNASDSQKTYDYEESVTRTGTTGQEVSPNGNDRKKSYVGQHFRSREKMPQIMTQTPCLFNSFADVLVLDCLQFQTEVFASKR